ncbi:MAG: glycosyltransferase family 2 protein [Candidatus Geothermincolia bacterium]
MKAPVVAAILLNWNGSTKTLQGVNSLLENGYEELRILVLDNGSQPEEATGLREALGEAVSIHHSHTNLGFSGGNNYAAELAQKLWDPDYLLLFNNDAFAEPGCVTQLVATAVQSERIACVAPRIVDNNGNPWYRAACINLKTGSKKWLRDTGKPAQTDFVSGCAMLACSEVVKQLGLFDSAYFAYFEDMDWSIRARRAGFDLIYEPRAVVAHDFDEAERHSTAYHNRLMARNRIYFMRKHGSLGQLALFLPYQLLVKGLASVAFSLWRFHDFSFCRSFLAGCWEGLRMHIVQDLEEAN